RVRGIAQQVDQGLFQQVRVSLNDQVCRRDPAFEAHAALVECRSDQALDSFHQRQQGEASGLRVRQVGDLAVAFHKAKQSLTASRNGFKCKRDLLGGPVGAQQRV